MSRKRLACLLAAHLAVLPSARRAQAQTSVTSIPADGNGGANPGPDIDPGPIKLTFTYPCTFAYADGKPYENRVMDYECDYMHASLKNADKSFDRLPTLAAQKAFLGSVIETADAAHNTYIQNVAAAIEKTDPSKLPKTLTQTQRLARIAASNVELNTAVFAAAEPFLWPPREGETYVQKTAGSWPRSWDPYIQPLYERAGQLQDLVRESEMHLIDKASADLEKSLRAKALTKAIERAKAPGGAAALDGVFDGGAGRGNLADGPLGWNGAAGTIRANNRASVVNAMPIPISDLKSLPPPIPKSESAREQRNYFARGVTAGMARLKDDARIGTWHAFGLTTTIGDPSGKASLIFSQEGPSCAVASQAEALNARGDKVPVDQLAREGYDKGYFVDYETASGGRDGGTPWQSVNSLLKDHGVKTENVSNATSHDLDQALRRSPEHDAIVYVKVKMFWNDPNVPEGATHAVYMTGEEVEPNGTVRGYYINDTGQGEAARFVSAADFDKVWLKQMVTFQK